MKIDRSTLVVLAIAFAAGWWMSAPAPRPKPADRPALKWFASVAKKLLWVAVFVEPAPPEPVEASIHARVDRDGFRILDNGRTM
jgi:hypothetical protein